MSSSKELSTIQNYLRYQEKKLYNLEHHINRMTRQFGKREKLLLSEIAKLHLELRDQTVKFQRKLYDHDDIRVGQSSATTSSSSPVSFNELPPVEEEEVYSEEADETTSNFCMDQGTSEIFYVRLKRSTNGSLGFNVVGGNSAEPDCDQGVYVSRILAECPESTKALQPYDRILKVNGRDVSQSSHHEAVEAFKTAEDPVVVQVFRRLNSSTKIRHDNSNRHSDNMSLITTSTQTDPISDDDDCDGIGENTALLGGCSSSKNDVNGDLEWSNRSNKIFNGSMPGNSTNQQIVADSMMAQLELAADGFIDDTDLDEECRQQLYDVEYEEVTLKRSTDGEKLGLTLCYGSGDNVDTDIFVGEVEPESVADKDGRIKAGDQILQINGVDVHTRNRAIELFQRENADITLLLARNSNGQSLRDIVHSVPRLEETIDEERSSSFMQDQVFEEDDGVLTDGTRGSGGSAHEKDSGISRTTDSEPDLPPPINSSPSKYSQSSTASSARSGASCTGKDVSTPENATIGGSIPNVGGSASRSPCISSERSFAANDIQNQSASLTKRSDSESSLERELHNLHREMEFIQVECDRLIEQHARAERQVRQQMDQANKLAETMDNFQKQQILSSQQNKTAKLTSATCLSNKSRVSPTMQSKNGRNFLDCTTETNDINVQPNCYRYKNGSKGMSVDATVVGRLSREETSSAYNTGNESCRSTPLNMSDAHLKMSYQKICQNVQRTAYDQNEYETIADEEEGKRDSAVFTLPLRNSSSTKNNLPSLKISRDINETSPKSKDVFNSFESSSKTDLNKNGVGVRLNAAEISGIFRQCTSSNFGEVSKKLSSSQFALGDVMYTNPENLQQTILLQQRLLRQAMIQQAHQLKAQQAFGKGPVPFYETYQNCDAKLEWKVKRRSDGSRYITKRPVRNKMLKERAQQLSNERVGVSTDDDAMSELKIGRYWTKDERKKHLERQKERKKRQEELIRRQNETLQQSNDQPILQLSHKKMMRRQGQQLLDKFTTVQEVLSHGTRTVDGKRAFGILSVTTV